MGNSPNPPLFSGVEEGFIDFRFRITDLSRNFQGLWAAKIMALWNGEPVGLIVTLGSQWQPATMGKNIPIYWGNVTYQSIGAESDRLVVALGVAYGRPVKEIKMKQEIAMKSVTLQGDPNKCPPYGLRMKLFFESHDPSQYAEVYTNLDPENEVAEIREKDPSYRQALLAALTM